VDVDGGSRRGGRRAGGARRDRGPAAGGADRVRLLRVRADAARGHLAARISPFGTVDYYKAVVHDAGGFTASQAFTRLYLVPGQYHCLNGGSLAVNDQQATTQLLDSLVKWVEQRTAPGTFSFPLAQPTATLSAITVQPLNPLSPPPGGARGLNTQYHWVGQFQPGNELWCATQGMDLTCSHRRPPE
jgi:hypothetical protein